MQIYIIFGWKTQEIGYNVVEAFLLIFLDCLHQLLFMQVMRLIHHTFYLPSNMDTVEQRVIYQENTLQKVTKAPMLHLPSISKSSEPEKAALISKIKQLQQNNMELHGKQQSLQNTVQCPFYTAERSPEAAPVDGHLERRVRQENRGRK